MPGKLSAGKYLWYGAAFLAADVVSVWMVERWSGRLATRPLFLALPLAFCLLHLATVAALMLSMIYVKARREWLAARALRLEPALQKAFSEHAFGGADQTQTLQGLLAQHPAAVERSLVTFMPSVKGGGRDRLGRLAADLGLAGQWIRAIHSHNPERRRAAVRALALLPLEISRGSLRRALEDREPEIRIIASRALVQSGDRLEIERIFRFALTQTLRVRACLAEDLRKHASLLGASAIPAVLASSDALCTQRLLEMLTAWQRFIPFEGWGALLDASANSSTRGALLRLLPYISSPAQAEQRILDALSDGDSQVRLHAADVAGQWELSSALPGLSALLLDSRAEVARAAAQALSHLGEAGRHILEETILGSARRAAGAALEALEYFDTGRVHGTPL